MVKWEERCEMVPEKEGRGLKTELCAWRGSSSNVLNRVAKQRKSGQRKAPESGARHRLRPLVGENRDGVAEREYRKSTEERWKNLERSRNMRSIPGRKRKEMNM